MFRRRVASIFVVGAATVAGACLNKSELRGSSDRRMQQQANGGTVNEEDPEEDTDHTTKPIDQGKINPNINGDQNGGDPTPILVFDPKTVAAVGVQELKQEADRFAWTVTQTGTVSYFNIVGDAVKSTKKWTGAIAGVGGARTYVLEGGSLVIVRSGGHLFFVDPSMPEGNLKSKGAPYYQQLSVRDRTYTTNDRGCAVSYRRGGKRYVGIGIGSKGDFVEVPQQESPPFAPVWNNATIRGSVIPPAIEGWGYSCYIDQQRLIYHSNWYNSVIKSFNIGTSREELDPRSVTPNGNFTSATIPLLTVGVKPQGQVSYAISGDNKGNVLNGSAYTMAADPVSQVVWVSSMEGLSLSVYPSVCFTSSNVCTGSATFALQAGNGAGIGPLSALGDGSVLGLSRTTFKGDNSLYRLSLKDPKNISAGITITKLATLDGEPYMYTDFTGATLYLTKAEQKVDLKMAGYKPGDPLAQVGFTWVTRDGQTAEWENISLEMRCYASSEPNPPPYEKVSEPIQSSTKQSVVSAPSCTVGKKGIDIIDLRLTQLNNGTSLMNIRKIQVTAYQ